MIPLGKKEIREKGELLAYDVTSAMRLSFELKAMLSAAGNLLSFALKLVVGILIGSPLWIANALYSLIPGITKTLCVYGEKQPPRVQKRVFRRAGFTMMLTAAAFTVVVLLRADEKQERVHQISAPVAAILIIAIIALFLLSLLGLHSSGKESNRTHFMLNLVSIFSALANLLLVQRLAYSCFTRAKEEYVILVNTWFGIGIGGVMLLISLIVILRNVMRRSKSIELQ